MDECGWHSGMVYSRFARTAGESGMAVTRLPCNTAIISPLQMEEVRRRYDAARRRRQREEPRLLAALRQLQVGLHPTPCHAARGCVISTAVGAGTAWKLRLLAGGFTAAVAARGSGKACSRSVGSRAAALNHAPEDGLAVHCHEPVAVLAHPLPPIPCRFPPCAYAGGGGGGMGHAVRSRGSGSGAGRAAGCRGWRR